MAEGMAEMVTIDEPSNHIPTTEPIDIDSHSCGGSLPEPLVKRSSFASQPAVSLLVPTPKPPENEVTVRGKEPDDISTRLYQTFNLHIRHKWKRPRKHVLNVYVHGDGQAIIRAKRVDSLSTDGSVTRVKYLNINGDREIIKTKKKKKKKSEESQEKTSPSVSLQPMTTSSQSTFTASQWLTIPSQPNNNVSIEYNSSDRSDGRPSAEPAVP